MPISLKKPKDPGLFSRIRSMVAEKYSATKMENITYDIAYTMQTIDFVNAADANVQTECLTKLAEKESDKQVALFKGVVSFGTILVLFVGAGTLNAIGKWYDLFKRI